MDKKNNPVSGYRIPFDLCYMGRIVKHTKEDHLRLFVRTKGRFTTVPVHEGIIIEGTVEKLKGKMIHYSYRDIAHHLQKINVYTSQAAEKNVQDKKRFSKCWVAFKFPVSFIVFYFSDWDSSMVIPDSCGLSLPLCTVPLRLQKR